MVALTKEQIPNEINTVERLAAWSLMVLSISVGDKAIVENAGEIPEQLVQTFMLRADDGSIRSIYRCSLPVDPAWETNGVKFWENINDLANLDIPTAFTNA